MSDNTEVIGWKLEKIGGGYNDGIKCLLTFVPVEVHRRWIKDHRSEGLETQIFPRQELQNENRRTIDLLIKLSSSCKSKV